MATTQTAASTVDPAKLLAIVRRWCPGAQVEVPITLVKSFIEAAARGSSGQLRLGLLEDFILGLDAQLSSNSMKINKLKKQTVRMAADPLHRPKLRPGHPAELARAALAAVERAADQVLSVERIHAALRRVKPKIRRTSTYALVKRMTDCGWLERDFAGVYGLPSGTRKPYEARTLQLLRLVYTAPDHEMGISDACAVLGWSPKLLSATASELCSRNLLAKPQKGPRKPFRVPREIVDKLERGEGILIAPGKLFYARAGGPPVDHSVLVTLRPERPPVDLGKLAQEVERLKGLKKRQQIVALDATAKALGVPRSQLELMVRPAAQVVKNTERNAIRGAAKEKWRADYCLLAKHPERMPVREKLWEDAREIPGLTREIFREVISEEGPSKSGPRPGIRAKKAEKNGAN
jgi:hypothetical protein